MSLDVPDLSPRRSQPATTAAATASARQSTLRESNLALVVRTVAAAAEAPSRAEVAAATGMTRATASRLVDELVRAGIVDEIERPAVLRRGRPMTPLVAGSRIVALGLQVDAGFLAARLVDLRGQTLAEHLQPADLAGSDPAPAFVRLGSASEALLARLPPDVRLIGAGLALPGIVDQETGRLLHAPNLGWSDLDPADLLGSTLAGLPLTVGNEADLAAATVSHHAPGRAGKLSDFLYLSGEIGIGGAAVRGGQVVTGRHGWAGEIGHVCVDPNGPPCRCGSTGCLEQYAGRHALTTAAGLTPDTPADQLTELARNGHRTAQTAITRAARALGIALASTMNILDIPTVVLGGYLATLTPLLRPDVEEILQGRVLSARWISPTVRAHPQPTAPAATGAAFRRLAAVVADPARWTAGPHRR
ncbi:ROK family transcriptional regulator [Parafrankia sp. FMc2]|uniref:ROK family transcriptional regulator n=1 Tax=Parafrankia sp. FMc2 TaxID=3233196 RepID=UPI0034D4B9A9